MNTPSQDLRQAEGILAKVLRWGVSISFVLLVIGLSFMLSGLQWLETGTKIVNAGLAVLIATPVIRVALSIFVFARQKDWRFALITTIVLALLCISFALGQTHG